MDGVICDFLPAFLHLADQTDLPISHVLSSQQDQSDQRLFYAFVEKGLFATLPKMPDADYLLSELDSIARQHNIKIEILSSLNSREPKLAIEIEKQKTQWLVNNGVFYFKNFVWLSQDKGNYARPDCLLIDDSAVPIEAFLQNHGQAIAHINAEYTIFRLKNMLAGV